MKIALFGISGRMGSRIAREALSRGHQVSAVVRDLARLPFTHPQLAAVLGDVSDPASVAQAVAGHEAVLSAVGPHGGAGPELVVQAARALIEGLTRAGVRRLVVVGGAGSLEVSPGVELVDAPGFPPDWRDIALAHREALAVYRAAAGALDWTYLSPAALTEPGVRTGNYRTGLDQLVTDAKGESRISMEDLAVAMLDELEQPRHLRRRMTIAY